MKMFEDFKDKKIFELAKKYAFEYVDQIGEMPAFPKSEKTDKLTVFDEPLPKHSTDSESIIQQLNNYGSPSTTAIIGGRYFGFVNGGAVPVALATKWLTDVWDQNAGLTLTSPISSKLESVCESWLVELFGLPKGTVAGFVSGTSMANLSALAAARYRILMNQGWDVNQKGFLGAPQIRIIGHTEVHSSIKKTLAILGFGIDNVEWIESDEQGKMIASQLPDLDNSCLVLMQAGNVNTGAYDPFDEVCTLANEAGAWVHIDGAFGLWAQACKSLKYLTTGMEKANSWAVDGHKTLNTPYDSGIVLCKDEDALVSSMQASANYLNYTENREPLLYGPEMSKRSRAIELWATMKYLGKEGIDEMITGFHYHAKRLSELLAAEGFEILNEVVFNQVLVACESDEKTNSTLRHIQQSGEAWMGVSKWGGKAVIRVSICSWATTEKDIERTVRAFVEGRENGSTLFASQ